MEERFVNLNPENIASEHICCAFSDKKCSSGYQAKKDWLKEQMPHDYVFRKLDVRGKVFIEYVPAEYAWCPIDAPGYVLINCFWVSGQFKGKGYGKQLLADCVADSQGKNGVVVVTSPKKQPFMSDRKFFEKQGFEHCDSAPPYFELWYKRLNADAPVPKFKDCVRSAECDQPEGLTVYYSPACPFTEYYAAELEVVATEKGYSIKLVKIENREQAQNHFVPFTNYSVFYEGKFVTQHILNENYFNKFIAAKK